MNIQRLGTQPSAQEPSSWFTGTVRIDPLFRNAAKFRTRLSETELFGRDRVFYSVTIVDECQGLNG